MVQKKLEWQSLSHILSVSCSAWPMTIMISLLSLSLSLLRAPCYFPFPHFSRSATFCEKRRCSVAFIAMPEMQTRPMQQQGFKLHDKPHSVGKLCVFGLRETQWVSIGGGIAPLLVTFLDCISKRDPCNAKCACTWDAVCFCATRIESSK